jgi:hypothetical protein
MQLKFIFSQPKMSSLKLKTINEAGSPLYVSSVLSTPYGITVSNNLNVNGTSYILGNSTFDTVLANAICSCATTPTLASHLANKSYVDSKNVATGQLVYFYAFDAMGSGIGTITLPPGRYIMRVDGICMLYLGGGTSTMSITGTWGSAATATGSTTQSMSAVAECGSYIFEVFVATAVSPAFNVGTTTSNSLSINVSASAGTLDKYTCKVSFFAVA